MRTDERAAANASAQPAAGLGRATVPPEATKAVGPLMFAPLRYREYRLLLSGAIVTQTGHWMQQVAQGWLMLLLTDSAFYLGLLGFARGIPMLVLSLPAGVAIDRLNRRRLLMGMQAGAALVAISMAVLTVTGLVQAWHLIAAALIGGSFASVIFPTRQALVPTLVPTDELRRAVALNSAGQNSTRIAGPSIAGVVIALVGVGGCFVLQAFGFIYAAFVTTRLKATPSVSRDDRPGVWQSLVEGLRYIGASPALRGLLSLAAVPTLLAMPYVQLLPAFARNELGTDATGLGVLMAAVGVGAVAGALGVAAAGEIQRRGVLLLGAACGLGLSLVLFSLSTNFWIALALLPLVGVFGSIYMSINTTLLLAHVKDEYRGRVMSVYMLTWGLMPLGVLPEGALAQAIGVRPTLAIAGAVCSLFVVAVGLRSPTLRALR